MTDRELLEAAAKAAGIEFVWDFRSSAAYGDTPTNKIPHDQLSWNPLIDDGAALRLACTLRINIEHAETLSRKAHGVNCWPVGRGDCGSMENELTDYNAATRRAIVRAAAAMAPAHGMPGRAERFGMEEEVGDVHIDPLRDVIRQMTLPPRKGTPAADLTERERLAVCIAAGAPTESVMDGLRLTVRTTVPCGVADRGDGGYIVTIGRATNEKA